MIRWIKAYADNYETECGQGRIKFLDNGYFALWTRENGHWITVKTWSGRDKHAKLLPTAKVAVEQALSRKSKVTPSASSVSTLAEVA